MGDCAGHSTSDIETGIERCATWDILAVYVKPTAVDRDAEARQSVPSCVERVVVFKMTLSRFEIGCRVDRLAS